MPVANWGHFPKKSLHPAEFKSVRLICRAHTHIHTVKRRDLLFLRWNQLEWRRFKSAHNTFLDWLCACVLVCAKCVFKSQFAKCRSKSSQSLLKVGLGMRLNWVNSCWEQLNTLPIGALMQQSQWEFSSRCSPHFHWHFLQKNSNSKLFFQCCLINLAWPWSLDCASVGLLQTSLRLNVPGMK